MGFFSGKHCRQALKLEAENFVWDFCSTLYNIHVFTEQGVGDELSPKCLDLRVGRLVNFTKVDRHVNVQTDTHTDRQTDRQTQTDRQRQTQPGRHRQIDRQTDRHRQTDRQTDR